MTDFEKLLKILMSFQGILVLDFEILPETFFVFKCSDKHTFSVISSFVREVHESHNCNLVDYGTETYQLVFEGDEECRGKAINLFIKMFSKIQECGSYALTKLVECGLPDLSLCTIRQFATELKKRQNLCFALVWMEDNNTDNIAIEGSGNPTMLIGLLTRGVSLSVDWCNKGLNLK